MRPIATDGVAWSVYRSVCLSATTVSESCKTTEPIEMSFWMWTRVGPRNHALDGLQIPHMKGQF